MEVLISFFLKVHIVYLMILDYMLSIQFLHLKVTWNDGHVALNRRRLRYLIKVFDVVEGKAINL